MRCEVDRTRSVRRPRAASVGIALSRSTDAASGDHNRSPTKRPPSRSPASQVVALHRGAASLQATGPIRRRRARRTPARPCRVRPRAHRRASARAGGGPRPATALVDRLLRVARRGADRAVRNRPTIGPTIGPIDWLPLWDHWFSNRSSMFRRTSPMTPTKQIHFSSNGPPPRGRTRSATWPAPPRSSGRLARMEVSDIEPAWLAVPGRSSSRTGIGGRHRLALQRRRSRRRAPPVARQGDDHLPRRIRTAHRSAPRPSALIAPPTSRRIGCPVRSEAGAAVSERRPAEERVEATERHRSGHLEPTACRPVRSPSRRRAPVLRAPTG